MIAASLVRVSPEDTDVSESAGAVFHLARTVQSAIDPRRHDLPARHTAMAMIAMRMHQLLVSCSRTEPPALELAPAKYQVEFD